MIENLLRELFRRLENGAAPLDIVEEAIVRLEDSGLFNAGRGARLQTDGVARLDASLMDGTRLAAGAVAALEGIGNPIAAARRVMDRTPHLLMVGEGAKRFALAEGLAPAPPIPPSQRRGETRYGTVGAVALGCEGTIAAGASTGGIGRMLPGRVGDSPLIGAGVYADNRAGGISMTGEGEGIIREGCAREIALLLEKGVSPAMAGRRVLMRMRQRTGALGGALILNVRGAFAVVHTTPSMAAGWVTSDGVFCAPKF